ncbi:deoxyhypusine hydroxylase [Lithohypha guttulata]|uniref:Deoxyhypusine hydroxylase n=1 Tax=Lithohypha guttulata TaxID=1690604 RepID=A0AAN7SYN2_9EURO|nr:deoxyhypusine hydroxylase [Lithohypha guttulata]
MSNLESKSGSSQKNTTIDTLRTALGSETVPLASRFRALFSLKHLAAQGDDEQAQAAIEAIAAAFTTPSALLKHELSYCLGQTRSMKAVPFLRDRLDDKKEDPMVRHESAEALAAIGDAGSLDTMKKMRDDPNEPDVVRETCDIAVDRITWQLSEAGKKEVLKQSDFASIDPAPPMETTETQPNIQSLQWTLLDTSLPLFKRYRAMFALRDLASPPDAPTAKPAVEALATGFSDKSALFRHEIAFVFGQLSHPASIPSLHQVLSNQNEESMVRHEAAEALGSLGEEPGVENMLKQFLNDAEQVVRDSVVVALDMAEYERTGQMEYATIPEVTASA